MINKTSNKVIGRGLGALLQDTDMVESQSKIIEIDLSYIDLNENQPRKDFCDDDIKELACSIKENGLIQPITVTKRDNGRYLLIAGERRYRAAKMANIDKLSAYIMELPQHKILEVSLIENIQRKDLNPIEIAHSLDSILKNRNITQEELSLSIGKSRTSIANYVRLLKLPTEIQKGLIENKLSMGHARAILAIDDHSTQTDLYKKVVSNGLSVRQIENLIRDILSGKECKEDKSGKLEEKSDDFNLLINQLSKTFLSKVTIKQNKKTGKGHITIPFANEDEMERIFRILDKLH